MTITELCDEFEKQIETLKKLKYPEIPHVDKLKELLTAQMDLPPVDEEKGTLPFVVVVKSEILPSELMMNKTNKDGKSGITKLFPHTPDNFETISTVVLPETSVYLLLDIDRGKENINLPPQDALKIIRSQDRSPLTIDEGIAIVTHYPQFLKKNNCFSLLASRNPKDKRVPAIWINAEKHPNLGWCWDGNPHTWLGSASCKLRR